MKIVWNKWGWEKWRIFKDWYYVIYLSSTESYLYTWWVAVETILHFHLSEILLGFSEGFIFSDKKLELLSGS
jgi:hypothetical protein